MSEPQSALQDALSDRYRLERKLGEGGMAAVYLAHDLKHDRKVAIKVLKPELAAVLGAERFLQEIRTTAALQHPHILPLFDSGNAGGFLFYVMPYVEGETLRAKLHRETQLGVDEAVHIAVDVAHALDYSHRHGVIHRDIKPENILLHDSRPVVADFGIALAVSAAAGGRITESGLSLGTPHYMSPEQATAEKEITGRSDIYSLGSVLFEMLAGNPPHTGASAQQIIMKIIAEPVPQVSNVRKTVPPHVVAAIAKALEKLPADRFETAKAFADALKNPQFVTVSTPVASASDRRGLGRGWVAAAVVAGILIGAVAARVPISGAASNDGSKIEFQQRTFAREAIYNARWGADAKTILYSVITGASVPSMRIVRPEYPSPQPFGPEVAQLLAVSSTNEVAMLLNPGNVSHRVFIGTLAIMSLGGGAPREIVENVHEADWSPDGTQLAITRHAGAYDQIEYPVGKVLYRGPAGGYLSDPRVSADGQRIAFVLHPNRGDDRGFVAVVDTKRAVTRLEEEFGAIEGMAWASDDRTTLFSAAHAAGGLEVMRWQVGDSLSSRALPNAGRLTMFDVRAGRWLVSRDDESWMLVAHPPTGAGIRDLSWLDASLGPHISADGQMVAFTDQGSLSGSMYRVMARKTDGSPAILLGEGSAYGISPDKRWVLAGLPTTPMQVRLYPIGAGSFRSVTWPKLVHVDWLSFHPDGMSLWVCGNEKDRPRRCYTSGLEGGEVTPATPDSVTGFPRPRPDRKASASCGDDKCWIYPIGGGARRELPGLNQRLLRWSPDGAALWVLTDSLPRQRRVERVEVATGRRTVLFPLEEPQGVTAPYITQLSVADDGRSYAYSTSTYYSLLFSVDGMR